MLRDRTESHNSIPGHGGEVRNGLDRADCCEDHDAEAVDEADEDGEGLHRDGGLAAGGVQLEVRVEVGPHPDAADAKLRRRRM